MAGRDPRPFLNTPEDRGGVVAVISFTFVVVATLANGIRVWIRNRSDGALGLDDALLVAANIIAIVQTSLVGSSVRQGLGRHFDTLDDASIAQFNTFTYISSILAILSMALSKLSVLQLQRRLCGTHSRSRYMRVMYWALAGATVLWTTFSVFALAFQCGTALPQKYQPDPCVNGVLWYPVTAMNAMTDGALAFSFTPVILKLAAKRRMKAKVMLLLSTRIFVCVAIIVQIASLPRGLSGPDRTRAMVQPVILQQIVMNLSIFTAVILGLHGFISNLTAGGFGVEVRESNNELSHNSYGRSYLTADANRPSSRPQYGSHIYNPSRTHKDSSSLRLGSANKSQAWVRHEPANKPDDSDRRSDGSQENIIKQTVTWQVTRDAAVSEASRGYGEDELQSIPPSGEEGGIRARNFLS